MQMASPSKIIADTMRDLSFVPIDRPPCFGKDDRTQSETRLDLWYYGDVNSEKGAVSVQLNIPDLSFIEPPHVFLPERPEWLQGWRPHLLQLGDNYPENLCYNDHQRFQLLTNDPGRAIRRVLADVSDTLSRISDPESTKEDSQREIAQLWRQDANFGHAYIDIDPASDIRSCKAYVFKTDNNKTALLISDEPKKLAAKIGVNGEVINSHQTLVYPESNAPLYMTAKGVPSNVFQIKEWLEETSPISFQQWHKSIQSPETYRDQVRLHLFRTRGQAIGYFLDEPRGMQKVRGARKIREYLRDHVYKKPARIIRISAIRFDNEYLIRRNLRTETKDLRGINILQIGCGAIGGYLAQSLVQVGAGGDSQSQKAKLTLCDNDGLTSENLGRHILGTQYYGANKAQALAKHLTAFRASAAVVAEACVFFDIESKIDEFDIIIDAGGYESLSRHLSRLLRKKNWFRRGRALLSVWVEGQGGVTRCLLQDSARAACYDCLWSYDSSTVPTQRKAAYSDPRWTEMASDGYATMTPFSVSSPQAATALALDSLLDWLSGNPSPRFRSRSAEGVGIKSSFSMDVKRAVTCPGCST